MSTDHDDALLRRFARENSEAAFDELVRRHVDLVYATAIRLTDGRSGLAADIAQTVFTDLARKAKTLPTGVMLAGWLHRAARLAAAAALRAESRRSVREKEAVMIHEMSRQEAEPEWTRIRPVLDDALDTLKQPDREALLLRFFHHQSLRDVGTTLGVSEDAARMRVDRALDKLRAVLAGRGIPSTAAALGLILDQNVVATAPATLANTLSAAALAAAAIPAATTTAITLLSMSTVKTAAIATAVAAILAVPVVSQQRAIAKLREENARLRVTASQPKDAAPTNSSGLEGMDSEALMLEVARLRAEVAAKRGVEKELATAKAQIGSLRSLGPDKGSILTPAALNAKIGADFLAANAKRPGVRTTASGLQYEVLQPGRTDGKTPSPTDSVKVHYHGTLVDGSVFDSSVDRGEPATFPLKGVIPGWTEGMQLMSEGGKYKFYIPSELAYGEKGPSPNIGPNSVLVFEIELLSVEAGN
jgi:RNA polymerase sigma factor (sigma-70 family)